MDNDRIGAKELYGKAYILFEQKKHAQLLEVCTALLTRCPKSKEAKWALNNFPISWDADNKRAITIDPMICRNCGEDSYIYNKSSGLYDCKNCGRTGSDHLQKVLKDQLIEDAGEKSAFRKTKTIMKLRKFAAAVVTILGAGILIKELDLFAFYYRIQGKLPAIRSAAEWFSDPMGKANPLRTVDVGFTIGSLIGGIIGLYIVYRLIAGTQNLHEEIKKKSSSSKKSTQ